MKIRKCIKCGITNEHKKFKVKSGKERNICVTCYNIQHNSYPSTKQYEARPERKHKRKERHLMKEYGITIDDYKERVTDQNGKCLICKSSPEVLVVDHDHDTQHIRGLLCNNCNTGLGLLKDNIEVLQSAIEYLRKYE